MKFWAIVFHSVISFSYLVCIQKKIFLGSYAIHGSWRDHWSTKFAKRTVSIFQHWRGFYQFVLPRRFAFFIQVWLRKKLFWFNLLSQTILNFKWNGQFWFVPVVCIFDYLTFLNFLYSPFAGQCLPSLLSILIKTCLSDKINEWPIRLITSGASYRTFSSHRATDENINLYNAPQQMLVTLLIICNSAIEESLEYDNIINRLQKLFLIKLPLNCHIDNIPPDQLFNFESAASSLRTESNIEVCFYFFKINIKIKYFFKINKVKYCQFFLIPLNF